MGFLQEKDFIYFSVGFLSKNTFSLVKEIQFLIIRSIGFQYMYLLFLLSV